MLSGYLLSLSMSVYLSSVVSRVRTFLQPLARRHPTKSRWWTGLHQNEDSNFDSLCERMKNEHRLRLELGRRELFRFGLEPGDLGRNSQALWECGRSEGPVTDESGRERGPPRKNNSAQSTIHYAGPFCHLWSERRAPTKASNSTNWVVSHPNYVN